MANMLPEGPPTPVPSEHEDLFEVFQLEHGSLDYIYLRFHIDTAPPEPELVTTRF